MRLPILLATVIAAIVLLLASCGGGSSTDSATPTPTAQASTSASTTVTPFNTEGLPPDCAASTGDLGLISKLDFDKDSGGYNSGDPIVMTLVVSNCGGNDAKLVYPTTQRYIFIVSDEGGNDMWRSTDGKVYEQTEGSETVAAKGTAEDTETWDQKDRSGSQVPNGEYKVSAFSVGCVDTARSDCEFGPISFIQIEAGTATPATTATPTPTSTAAA